MLRTLPGGANNEHIDCSPSEIGTIQLKLRIVLQGSASTLYFVNRDNQHYFIHETKNFFLMDGSWPHGMNNNSEYMKYTLCLGAPWTQSDFYPLFEKIILKDQLNLPVDLKKYYRRD